MSGATLAPHSARTAALATMGLFAASAAFTLWRNTEIAVLVDLAYPLNTATRIALGDVPYAQFPLAQAPLHFLVQAALIRLFGPHYVVQIAYATILGGLATALTYALARRLLAGAVRAPHLVAALVALPLVPLGIYAVYPHPFYDPDACLAVLAALAAVVAARDRPTAARWVLAGALLTVPLWVKQNIGGPFLVLAFGALAVEALARPLARRGVRWSAVGIGGALVLELAALQVVVGIDRYLRWALGFALEGRGVSAERAGAFLDPRVVWPAALILVPAALAARLAPRHGGPAFAAALVVPAVVGALVPAAALSVVELFPPLLIAAAVLAAARWPRERPSFETLLPIVLTGTVLGTIQSQGIAGSTFGIFPLLALAVACIVRDLAVTLAPPGRLAPTVGAVLATALLVAGAGYTLTNARLRFIDVDAPGPVVRSSFPSLAGLSARGPYVGDLDAMLVWIDHHIPAAEPMTFLPGEDPAFFALARKPGLPSVYFYDIATPYSPRELARIAEDAHLRWVVVKDRLQITEEPPLEQALVAALTERATLVERVGPYRVYRRP